MIGNDIVDLALARIESNWQREGYLNKIFTISEQFLMQKSTNQELAVWNLWSRKEAVYKILLQKGGMRGYYPTKIECLNLHLENGKVQFENQIFYTKTVITNEFVYTLAVENKADFANIKAIEDRSSIFKINGIPFFKSNDEIKNASKTHHGTFERIVFLDT